MTQPILPPGASIIGDFLPEGAGGRLLDWVDSSEWRSDLKRRVQHYGWHYDYRERRVTPAMRLGPLPDWLVPVSEAVSALPEFPDRIDQVIVNEYLPGQGISAHIDCEPCFGPAVASLSLGGPVQMLFRCRQTGEQRGHVLEPLSLLILSGQARYDWTHEIPARKSDLVDGLRRPRTRRVSLTFRTVSLQA
ncbi:MAG: alpha-ketoglutarate-dependent dioxygenase AlkB [Glycocaulis sp.]